MYSRTRSHYQSQAVETASPAQLVTMLYDGALAAITRAEQALSDPDRDDRIATANGELQRAQDIVTELTVTLDRERGGAIAANLAALYAYCGEQLLIANLRKDPSGLADVRGVIAGLRETWAQACLTVPAPA